MRNGPSSYPSGPFLPWMMMVTQARETLLEPLIPGPGLNIFIIEFALWVFHCTCNLSHCSCYCKLSSCKCHVFFVLYCEYAISLLVLSVQLQVRNCVWKFQKWIVPVFLSVDSVKGATMYNGKDMSVMITWMNTSDTATHFCFWYLFHTL